MPLNALLGVPDDEENLRAWMFDDAQDHLVIRQAIQKQFGVNLPIYVLDPVSLIKGGEPSDKWLQDHQSAHNDFNGLFNLQANDLESVNWKDPLQRRAWSEIHYLEHLAIHSRLGI